MSVKVTPFLRLGLSTTFKYINCIMWCRCWWPSYSLRAIQRSQVWKSFWLQTTYTDHKWLGLTWNEQKVTTVCCCGVFLTDISRDLWFHLQCSVSQRWALMLSIFHTVLTADKWLLMVGAANLSHTNDSEKARSSFMLKSWQVQNCENLRKLALYLFQVLGLQAWRSLQVPSSLRLRKYVPETI